MRLELAILLSFYTATPPRENYDPQVHGSTKESLKFELSVMCVIIHVRSQRGTGVSDPTPLKNHKLIGFPSNTCPDPLKITKLGPLSARQRNAIPMAFRWQADNCQLLEAIGVSLPLKQKKNKKNPNQSCPPPPPSDKTFWIRACYSQYLYQAV